MALSEEEMLKKRLVELAKRAYERNVYTFSGFLSPGEMGAFYQVEREISHVDYEISGGVEQAERVMIKFGSEGMFGYREEFPIVCLIVKPLMEKFSDALTHRDFLGALMNLGIERSMVGDIVVKGVRAYIFCMDSMGDFIIENLVRVKHTNVKCEKSQVIPEEVKPKLKEENVLVSSERLDGVIAKAYHLSRSQVVEIFRGKRVFVDGRLCENNSRILKDGEVVSVRGVGKFLYIGKVYETKKGKNAVKIGKYV
mgnify:CR=1 FL=1